MDDNNTDNSERENSPSANYVRKKNLIPGWDNDHLIIAGLGILTAIGVAPYVKQLAENFFKNLPQNQQLPPNNSHQMYYPPPQQQMPIENHQHEIEQEQGQMPNPMSQHEKAIAEQKAYEAAKERDEITGPASFSMVPDRSTMVADKNKNKNKGTYEAGSNISGSYS